MEQTQQLDWDESALGSDSTEGSQEPVGKLRLCSGVHGPERDFWIHIGDNIIGRLESCNVTLPAQSVSKKHAIIEAEADCHTIYDCNSLNKTRRRKTVLKPHVRYALADGDLLLFADVACQYFILSQTDREEGVLPRATAAQQQDGVAPLNPCRETASMETTQDFNSDDESILVPATQTNAVKSLVFVKTPAARKMGYGGVLAKDSDEEDDVENALHPPGRSKGSEDSTSSREGGDLCTSAALNTPSGSTVIPESDDECPENSVVSAPSMHLQYDSETETEESLIKPDSAAKLHPGASAPTPTAGKSLKVMDEGGKAKVSVVGTNLDTRSVADAQCGGVTEQKPALYHLDSDTDVEGEDEEVITRNGAQEHKPALFHVNSDTDEDEQKPSTATSGGDFVENRELLNGAAALPDLKAAPFHLDSDTDVEEDVDGLAKVKPGLPNIDFGSDTDVEEYVNAPVAVGVHDSRRDDSDDVENEVASSTEALDRGSRVGAAQDSDTDVDEEPTSGVSAKAQEGDLKPDDTQDSDTDVEDEVVASTKCISKSRGYAECSGNARKVRDTSEAVPVKDKDDEDTDIEDANEKPCSDTEADDSPYIAMEATQCYVDAVPSDGVEAKDGNLSSESGDDEEEATQAFVFKSPPIKPVPFKKPHVPSPGASALSLPVCTSSEKEEYSDDENFAVAETQSFCRGPDLSDICVDEEPTQPFFLKGGIGLECPPISMLKDIGSATEQGNARMPGRNSSGEDMGTETLAEEATQLFCAHSTPVTPGAKQCQDPSQDETQPIELYLGLQAGRVESSEADVDHQSVMDQKTKAKLSSRSDNEVKYFAAVKNTRPSFLSTVKTGDSHSSSTSLLESQESLKQSLEAAHSEESTQPLSLRLSEDPTQSYTIDLSKETEETEAFDTEPVLPLLNVQEIRSDGPAIEKDGASPKAFESITTDSGASGQFMQDSGIPTTPAIPPSIDKASEPVPSDRVKSIAPKEVSEAELFVKKKEPALNKRGRKKKPVVEEETVVPPAEPVTVLALPAQEATTYLPDTELEVKEKQPQFRGRQTRRTVANSSSLGKNRKADVAMTEDHEKPNVEEPKEMVDLKEGRKVRQGKGTRRNVTPQEPHCVTVAETDMMEEPSTIQSSTSIDATSIPQSLDQDIEIAAPKEQSTADVDARTTTNLSTPSVAASTTKGPHIVCLDRVASTNTFIKDMKAKISSPVIDDLEKSSIEFPTANVEAISTDAPAAIRPSTSRYDGTKIATTPIAQRRNGKRGQGPDKATLTPVEPERRGYCNQKILATLNAEVEIMEKPKVESAPAHGRGRSKKAPSTNISEQQLEPVVIPVELATLTRTSRTMKLSTVAGSEEELRPAASVSGKLKRVAPVQKEEVDEKKDHLWASGGRKPPKKPLTVEIHKAAEVEPSPAKCREEEVITGSADKQPHKKKADDSSLSTSRHVKETCPSEQLSSGGEQVLSDQSDASACKHVLIANSAAATMVEQAITNEPTLEHASLSKPKESSSAAGKHAPSKQKTVDKPEDMTSLAINTLATGKRDTMEAPEEMTKTPSNKRGNRKRGTGQTKNVEVAMETANSVAVPNDFMKREIVKTSEEVTEEVETPVSAPHVSKKRETTEVKERKAAAKNVIPTPRASRARKNIDTDREGTEEPAMAARASRKRGIVKTDGESVEGAVLARTSKKRGAMDVDKVVVQETNNHDLRAGSEQKKEQTCAADEEIKRKGGLANTAKTAECPGRKLAEKEGADESNAEKTRNAAQEQQQVVDSAIKDLATAETITPPKEVGRRRQQALKTETNFSKVEQGGCSKSKKRRAVSDEDTVATESAATTSNSNSEGSLERAVGGHKKQLAVADELGKATINQLGATEQECGQNSSLSYEGTTDSITIKGVEDSQSNRSQEKIAPYEGRERKEEGKPLETLEAEAQKNTVRVEGPQVRGRGSQRRQPRKVEETSMAEDQQAIVQKATEDIQEEARSWSASRSRSNGRSKTDSSQESVPQGRIRRKQSSASSESKAEDINTAQEAETPRGKGRGPNVSSSPGFFDDHGCPKIMFTGVIDENGEQVVQRLGGELADSVYECTHLVTDRIRRTVKFLCAVARGIPIVTLDWLEKCGKNKCFLSPSTFLVKDREQELNFNFRLSESLQKARKKHLLEGYEIHVTPSVKPEPEHMKDIIQCSGATFLSKMPREYKDKRVIISCSADIAKCKSALSASLPVANSEFILTGILQQLADLDAFRLEGTATARGGDEPRGGKRASTSSSTLPPHTGASKRRR